MFKKYLDEYFRWFIALLVSVGFIVFTVFIGVENYKFWQTSRDKMLVEFFTTPDCDPRKSVCQAGHDGRKINLRLAESVRYLVPFKAEITTEGYENTHIKSITLKFNMEKMEMGLNTFVARQDESGKWQGTVLLPVCSSGGKKWRMVVLLDLYAELHRAEYYFQVD